MSSFAGKVVIITGASSGIGAATAEHFASMNASLVLVGRNSDNLNKVKESCVQKLNSSNKVPLIVIADVKDPNATKYIVTETIKYFGKIDILINNAGIIKYNTAENVDLDFHDDVMNTNIRSVVMLTKEAFPYLSETKGNVVNVSSVAGTRSFPGVMSYCMSKAAMDQFTRCAALDFASKGVRVNSVNPGVIVTEIHRRSGMEEESYQQYLQQCKNSHALGRVGQPDEVATAIEFLASDNASFITGVLLPIDGGATSGIGAGAAEYLAKLGGSLVLVGRSVDGLVQIQEKCSRPGVKPPLIVNADVTEYLSPSRIIDEAIQYYGKLDVLINNAGILCRDNIENIDFDVFDKTMNTNLRSVITLTKAAVPYLTATQGCIVNVSSVTGNRSFAGSLSYCISKAALDQFTKCVALELAPKGIRVNSVNPGTITSGIHKKQGLSEEEYIAYLEKSKQMHALGRVGCVEEVVKGIAFLASDEASFTTGALLPIDGGRHVMTPR